MSAPAAPSFNEIVIGAPCPACTKQGARGVLAKGSARYLIRCNRGVHEFEPTGRSRRAVTLRLASSAVPDDKIGETYNVPG